MRTIVLASLFAVAACSSTHTRNLKDDYSDKWVDDLCRPATIIDDRMRGDGSLPRDIGLLWWFQCELTTIDHRSSGIVPILVQGDRMPHTADCAIQIGPTRVTGPLAPDLAVSWIDDPLLAARLRSVFGGIDPRRAYDVEATREGIHIMAIQDQAYGGAVVQLSVDGCARVDDVEPEVRKVGDPVTYATQDVLFTP